MLGIDRSQSLVLLVGLSFSVHVLSVKALYKGIDLGLISDVLLNLLFDLFLHLRESFLIILLVRVSLHKHDGCFQKGPAALQRSLCLLRGQGLGPISAGDHSASHRPCLSLQIYHTCRIHLRICHHRACQLRGSRLVRGPYP
jgi:hypothetical protein